MTTISKGFREQYRKALDSGGVIDAAEAKALAKSAKTPEDKQFLARHLATDAFDGAARTALAGKVAASSSLVGTTVGALPGGAAVTVTRELSAPGGYRTEDQARAAARLGGASTAIVQGKDGMWHAVALDVPAAKLSAVAPNGGVKVMPEINEKKLGELKDAALGAKDQESKEAAYRKLVAYELGVPESQVNTARNPSQLKAGAINIASSLTAFGEDSSGKTAFLRDGKFETFLPADKKVDAGTPVTVMSTSEAATDPRAFFETYLHESTHLAHEQRTAELYKEFQGSKASDFDQWLPSKAGKIDSVDYALAARAAAPRPGEAPNLSNTEALAYTEAFVRSFGRHGEVKDVRDVQFLELQGVARRLHGASQDVKDAVKAKLRDLYDSLPETSRQTLKDYFTSDKAKGTALAGFNPAAD